MFKRDLMVDPGREAFAKALELAQHPLPWDFAIDDTEIAIIDANDSEVAFLPFLPTVAAAVEAAASIVTAVNKYGGYFQVATTIAPLDTGSSAI